MTGAGMLMAGSPALGASEPVSEPAPGPERVEV